MTTLISSSYPYDLDEFTPYKMYGDDDEFLKLVADFKVVKLLIPRTITSAAVHNILAYRCLKCCNDVSSSFTLYDVVSEENKYLELMRSVLNLGNVRQDRTRTGTMSLFGSCLQFSLRNNAIPVLTTKRLFFRGVVEELLWFIRGSTNSNELSEKNVTIWDKNGSLDNLKRLGFSERSQGELGPIYGYQWRNWNGDQLLDLIRNIKDNPFDRRHILSAWNRNDIPQMALPPCHIMCQFYVSTTKHLSCVMYQRSADMFLGVPFNIASYALLTYIIANLTNLKPDRLVINFGDYHVYSNHVTAVEEQLSRAQMHNFPTIHVGPSLSIDNLNVDEFKLTDYHYQPSIHADMSL